ncbi:FecR family protein [Pigmentibacter sp. JX0631]|uniref:FecR family protein n=1 Tax=Pigmentibacter sp. JX0631 TaxID=2976982 RepID=UPI0024685C6E|nr:FecR family protein [Pigmentibacter sp. JX0631]WGL60663.1 FecR family protein [Pigmentibacter sp. JX0631]
MLKIKYIIIFLFLLPKAVLAADDDVGKIENVIGKAEFIVGKETMPVKRGDLIHPTDVIKTGENTIVKILFYDGADIILYEKTELKIKEYSVNLESEKKSLKGVFEDIKGKIRFFVKPDKTVQNDVKYKTNNAVMGIRGTGGFIVAPETGETQLVVTTGKVELSNPSQPDVIQEVSENQWGKIIGNEPPPPPEPVTPELIESLKVEIPEGFENPPPLENENKEEQQDDKNKQQGNLTPPPVVPPPAKEAAAKDKSDDADDSEYFRIGPTFSAGLFNFFSFGLESRLFHFLGLSANIGGIQNFNLKNYPQLSNRINNNNNNTPIQSTQADISHVEVRAVIYPFFGSFFLGAAYGNRKVDARIDACEYISTFGGTCIPLRAFLKINTTYVTPQFGWLYVSKSGLTLGTEIGVQIPVQSGSEDFSAQVLSQDQNQISAVYNSYAFYDFQRQVRDNIGDYFRSKALPFWNIIKIGWLF